LAVSEESGCEELLVVDVTAGIDELLEGVSVVPLIHIHRSRHGTISQPKRGELP
jgi:hypothetical protein